MKLAKSASVFLQKARGTTGDKETETKSVQTIDVVIGFIDPVIEEEIEQKNKIPEINMNPEFVP